MAELQPYSPLISAPVIGTDFEMRELPRVVKVRVQALRRRGLNTPCSDAFPALPNTALGDDPVLLWKAPDDWLVYSETLSGAQLCDILSRVSASAPLIVTDVSSASVVLKLRGARVADILMRDCTLDLEGDAIRPGTCAQTALAQVNVMLHRLQDGKTWRLFIERSVALHVWDWLSDSCAVLPPN